MVIFRSGLPVVVPADYARSPEHSALVRVLSETSRYQEAVRVLETNALSWLAADVLTGQPWAQRYLNTTARLSLSSHRVDRRVAAGGVRALMRVLAGVPGHVGRRRAAALTVEELARGSAAVARWRATLDTLWGHAPEAIVRAVAVDGLSRVHQRALLALLRRPRIKKVDVALNLASWETGLPLRRIRQTGRVADLVYG